jgi:hypothetical protein
MILDPEQDLCATGPRHPPDIEGVRDMAEVKEPGWRGGEAGAHEE